MRQKVLDYIEKPTKKAFAELTTMEQQWAQSQTKGKGGADEKPKPSSEKKKG